MPPEFLPWLVTNDSVVRNMLLLLQFLISVLGFVFVVLNLQTSARAARVNAYLAVLDIVQSQSARDDRKAVFETYRKKGAFSAGTHSGPNSSEPWTASEELQAESVVQVYDQLGQFCKLKSIPVAWIVDSRYGSICHVWSACGDLIVHLREVRQTPMAWRNAEWLCNAALVKYPDFLEVEKGTGTVNSQYRDLPRLVKDNFKGKFFSIITRNVHSK